MVLYPISSGIWEVYAVCDENGNCAVLDELVRLEGGNKTDKSLAAKMRHLLEQWVPTRMDGPRTHNENISKKLTDNIFEFKKGQKKGPKIRVFWFYGVRKQVICTCCFLKRSKTPKSLLAGAEDLWRQFRIDSAIGDILIIGE